MSKGASGLILAILILNITLASGSTVSIPVCRSRDSGLRYLRSFRNCRSCCTYTYRSPQVILKCNSRNGNCLVRAPLPSQSSSQRGSYVYILFRCNAPGYRCNIPAGGKCSLPSLAPAILADKSPKRVMCALLSTRNRNARCIELDVRRVKLRAKSRRCRARVDSSVWFYGPKLLSGLF